MFDVDYVESISYTADGQTFWLAYLAGSSLASIPATSVTYDLLQLILEEEMGVRWTTETLAFIFGLLFEAG